MDDLEKDLIDAIRNDRGYNFISKNYNLMSVYQLQRVALELIYEIGRCDDKEAMFNNVADELEDFWGM